jgi:diacylglycerol kinase (ATP)
MTIGLFVNPTAGRGLGKRHHADITAELTRLGVDFIDYTSSSRDLAVSKAQTSLARGEVTALFVAGGDGMINIGLNLAMDAGIPLGIIPCGTGNDIARALSLPIDNVVWATQVAVDHLDIPRTIDLGKATSSTGDFYFLGSIAAGFDALVNARANKMKRIKGPVKYRIALYRELAKFKKLSYKLTVDGEIHLLDAMLCTIANVPSYGGGMLITPEAQVDDGQLDLFIVHKISRPELIRVFPHVYTGTHVEHPAVEIVRVKNVVLEANAPVFADGEASGHAPVSISVVPAGIRVLAPAPTRL